MRCLANSWNVQVTASLEYVPVGFGSHHWSVRDADGGRWFVNVDELPSEPPTPPHPLRSWATPYRVAADPRATTATPSPSLRSRPPTAPPGRARLRPRGLGPPHLDGESFAWQPWEDADPDLAPRLWLSSPNSTPSRGPPGVPPTPRTFAIPHRDTPRRPPCTAASPTPRSDPSPAPLGRLITRHAPLLSALLSHYDALADAARAHPDAFVLTHGEPHPATSCASDGRLLLIDWDSAPDRPARTRPVELRPRRPAPARALPPALGPHRDRRLTWPSSPSPQRRRQRAASAGPDPRGHPREPGNYRR